MSFGLLLLVTSIGSPTSTTSDADVLAAAERSFDEGAGLRDDEAKARPAFARAAGGYDELWRRGRRNPDLALNRAAAHRLAGNLPAAIVALHDGLGVARWHRPLQVSLEEVRGAVAYPAGGDLESQCRPPAPGGLGTRFSPADMWIALGVLWLVACAGLARFAMTRAPSWLVFGAAVVVAVALLGSLWLRDQRRRDRENEYPLVVVARDTTLRRGNSDAYPARLDAKLPRGVEARKLSARGGWVQVRLAGGAVGWIPASAVVGT